MPLGPILTEMLKRYGLQSLTQWATDAIVNGLSEAELEVELFKRPEFKSRFAGIFMLEATGEPPISIDEYLAFETTAHALATMWGVKLSKSEVDNLIGNNVSNVELQARFDLAAEAMFESDDESITELRRMNPLVGHGELIRYFMNPKEEFGKMQASWRQAQIAGAALRTGWGRLTDIQAQRLQEVGLDKNSATEGFTRLAEMDEIFEDFGPEDEEIGADVQVEALAGSVEAQETIERKQRKRIAEFEGGGGFAAGRQGFAAGEAE